MTVFGISKVLYELRFACPRLYMSHLKCLLASNNAKSNREKSIAVGGVLLIGVGSRKIFLILVFLFRTESSQSHGHFHHLLGKITVIPEK